ncbi:MAG: hypothetical protein PWP76_370 [Candidatus Diapherotrites archaeon]|nr:hypothetical protein [Candidatus Diapherotrites archaeon]MDN5366722.1 hypothetical protein [Candidatus Diapherotrites archaeon]
MISIEKIRERAKKALPKTSFQPYGDSPTVKSYTDWSAFENAFSLPASSGKVSGATATDKLTSFSFQPEENRMLAYHFSHLPGAFVADSDTIILESERNSLALQHVLFCLDGDRNVHIEDLASTGPKSATLDMLVRPGAHVNLSVFISGQHSQYLHIRYHLGDSSELSVNSAVLGINTHVHHEFFLNGSGSRVSYSGASIRGRSDLITNAFVSGNDNVIRIAHAVFSAPDDFVVHRGAIRVARTSSGTDADMDSAFYTTGGLAVSAPMLEVLTDNVIRASHRSRDLSLSDEQILYLQTRGLPASEALSVYVEKLIEQYVGNLASDERVISAIKSFSESLPR